ncbi:MULTISPECIES: hypothetical protein [unclassified Rhodococcus (in: high G+C Gram-positive bacteria)]|uniref:hypothetical protein n=1 Tax=unclassified Rhodococcus (in: high G+C Gram-positive bacteria) TaxID=192944 RepID=UPI00117AB6D5|nr:MULTISPECIES: hypothetical protein [unclassified Rhodococcus (in: high G+C Gram-positive bacteria)]MBP1161382.1 hypothetical protein [Rhodococcus sp. PvR099]
MRAAPRPEIRLPIRPQTDDEFQMPTAAKGILRARNYELIHPAPNVCVAHGQITAEHRSTHFSSVPVLPFTGPGYPRWKRITCFIAFWQIVEWNRIRAQSLFLWDEWPFCDECLLHRRKRFGCSLLAIVAGVLLFCTLFALRGRGEDALMTIVFFSSVAVFFAGLFTLPQTDKLAHGRVAMDGSALIVSNPHPDFEGAVAQTTP